MVNVNAVPKVDSSAHLAYQGLWYIHYRLFSFALAAGALYYAWSSGCCLLTQLAAAGYLAYVVFSSLPIFKEKGNYTIYIFCLLL